MDQKNKHELGWIDWMPGAIYANSVRSTQPAKWFSTKCEKAQSIVQIRRRAVITSITISKPGIFSNYILMCERLIRHRIQRYKGSTTHTVSTSSRFYLWSISRWFLPSLFLSFLSHYLSPLHSSLFLSLSYSSFADADSSHGQQI